MRQVGVGAVAVVLALGGCGGGGGGADPGRDGLGGAGGSGAMPAAVYGDWPAARDPRATQTAFPDWCYSMRLWPFDILTPDMADVEVEDALDVASDAGATAVIFYIEEEHMYGTFVDDAGFDLVLDRVELLTDLASERSLPTLVYLNGLEVMTRGAFDADCNPTGVPTMASTHPDWLQVDLAGEPIVYECVEEAWLSADWEDAWVSPFSGYRDLFKDRITALGEAGVDGIYIDATFLPGFQLDEDALRWGSVDTAFADAFSAATGLAVPTAVDLDDATFRRFLLFRHQAIADYLGELSTVAQDSGMVAFWESSTNDTPESVLLGNETSETGRRGLGFSPEIEPEGDWQAAFRMAKAARELNGERPMIYLGWPETEADAALGFAEAIAHSNNYYPTADAPIPEGAWDLLDEIAPILERRVPYSGNVALVYSARNKDYTWESESWFDAYVEAFTALTARHVPFRLVALEHLPEDGLEASVAVLPSLASLSDAEAAILAAKEVAIVEATPGTLDEAGEPRDEAPALDRTLDLEEVAPLLPFGVTAPAATSIEYYGDREGAACMFLFAVSPEPAGELVITGADGLTVSSYGLAQPADTLSGAEVVVALEAPLVVLEVCDE